MSAIPYQEVGSLRKWHVDMPPTIRFGLWVSEWISLVSRLGFQSFEKKKEKERKKILTGTQIQPIVDVFKKKMTKNRDTRRGVGSRRDVLCKTPFGNFPPYLGRGRVVECKALRTIGPRALRWKFELAGEIHKHCNSTETIRSTRRVKCKKIEAEDSQAHM